MMAITATSDAQVIDNSAHVDTLSLGRRLSFRTNAVDWAVLIPNIGIEFDLGNKNWNRWALGINLRDRWPSTHTYNPSIVYNVMEMRLDVRNYWRPRQISSSVPRHTKFIDKLFSLRRARVRHPLLAFYRGLYASYSDFSFKLGDTGRQGKAFSAGFTYGFVKPLYVFHSGSSFDFDMGISAGVAYAKFDKFSHDKENNCYPIEEKGTWKAMPVLTELRLGFVYRMGKYPVTKKYRWRYDADPIYAARIDSIRGMREKQRLDKKTAEDIERDIYKTYAHEYDSIAKVNTAIRKKQRLHDAAEKQRLKSEQKKDQRAKATNKKKEEDHK